MELLLLLLLTDPELCTRSGCAPEHQPHLLLSRMKVLCGNRLANKNPIISLMQQWIWHFQVNGKYLFIAQCSHGEELLVG